MKILRHDTVVKVNAKEPGIEILHDWQGAPFRPQKIIVHVYEDRAVIEVKGIAPGYHQGRGTATFKIGGDAKYRDCPQWLQDKLVEVGVKFWDTHMTDPMRVAVR